MKSDEIKVAFKECIKSILEIIQKHGKVQTYYDYTIKINLLNRFWYLELERKNIYPSLFEFENELMRLPAVRKCLDLMLKEDFPRRLEWEIVDKNGKPVQNPNYEPFLMAEILGTMITKYLEEYGYDFNEEKFEEIYEQMISYVYSPGRELVLVSPLENFDLKDLDEFSVDEYKIRRLSEWEIKTLIGHGYPLGFIFTPYHGNIKNIYCIERIIKTSKIHTPPLQPYIEDFVMVLRLFKPGVTGFNAILRYPRTWRISWGMSTQHRYMFTRPPRYVFERKDLEPFISFWSQFKKAKSQFSNNIKFSLRWFNRSYTEQEVLDSLLDLAIALEVLFNTSDRLDLYLPHFIGLSKDEKLKINEDVKELRKIRGAIVHSGYYECKQEFVNLIENYYRLSMQKFLKLLLSSNYVNIIESIKESILD
jgi:hypothetical protein